MTARAAGLRAELLPSPERWQGAWQITVLCMATVAIAMMLRIPEAALSCYLIFFAWRGDTGSAVMGAVMLIVATTLALPMAQPLLRLSANSTMWRFGLLSGLTLIGMTLAHASRAGPMIGTATFVFAFSITLYDVIPFAGLISRALAWMWVVGFVPMALLATLAIFAGTSPSARAEALIARRRAACAAPASDAARALLNEGGTRMDEWLARARFLGHARGRAGDMLAAKAEASYLDLARADAGLPARQGPPAPPMPAPKLPAFAPDLFSNPAHLRFGIKVLIAVLVTYVFYTIGGMFEIHTAMITCYFVALGTGAETRHKITLRLTGAVLGGGLGTLVLFLLMPHLDDLGHLLALVAIGAFPAAWISLGSERISYAGWQMALCYFLVILGGFGPVTDPSAAIDRILGIAVGITVVWAVFALFWPVSVHDRVDAVLDQVDTEIARTAGHSLSGRAVMRLNVMIADADRLQHYAPFEGGADPAQARRIAETRARLRRKLRHATGEPHA